MLKPSRRQLASYGATSLASGVPLGRVAKSLAAELVFSRRESQLNMLINDIAYQLETSGQAVNARVTSSSELNAKLRAQIEDFITSKTAVKRVYLEETIDQSVIGGALIETATKSWDMTIKNALMQLKKGI